MVEKEPKQPQTLAEYYEQLAKAYRKVEPERKAMEKKMEDDFREACARDTAGTLLNFINNCMIQFRGIQAQVDAAYPLGALARAVDVLGAQLAELGRRLAELEGKTRK